MLRRALGAAIARSDAAAYFDIDTAECDLAPAWICRQTDHSECLSARFDGPGFTKPISAALFCSLDGQDVRLAWRLDELRTSKD